MLIVMLYCVGSKPLSSSAAGVGVAGVKSTLAAGAASSAFSPAVSSMRSLWSPCGRAGNTRLRLTRETPTGEYADEAASSAMSNIATRRAIAEVNLFHYGGGTGAIQGGNVGPPSSATGLSVFTGTTTEVSGTTSVASEDDAAGVAAAGSSVTDCTTLELARNIQSGNACSVGLTVGSDVGPGDGSSETSPTG